MLGRRWWVPWLWLAPTLILLGVFLIYPALNTTVTSFLDRDSSNGIFDFVDDPSSFVGLDNYQFIVDNPQPLGRDTHSALLNTLLWMVLFTAVTVGLGLFVAVLAGRVRYEAVAKSAIFIPMAISFVALAVIWRFMYVFDPDIGTVNALTTGVGLDPTAWLQDTASAFSSRVLVRSPIAATTVARTCGRRSLRQRPSHRRRSR